MKTLRIISEYYPVKDWKIISKKIFHFYNEEETPFNAFCVEIGQNHTYDTFSVIRDKGLSPILRWMTEKQYYNYLKNNSEDSFIW